MKDAMENVIKEGTAKVVHRSDFRIAAKTGTAQVGSKDHRRQIAWLCGYFPADHPKYSFAVMCEGTFAENHGNGLEDGLLGGRDAGAIVKQVLDTVYGKKGSTDSDEESKADEDREAATDNTDNDNGNKQTMDDEDDSTPKAPPAPPVAEKPKPAPTEQEKQKSTSSKQ